MGTLSTLKFYHVRKIDFIKLYDIDNLEIIYLKERLVINGNDNLQIGLLTSYFNKYKRNMTSESQILSSKFSSLTYYS